MYGGGWVENGLSSGSASDAEVGKKLREPLTATPSPAGAGTVIARSGGQMKSGRGL